MTFTMHCPQSTIACHSRPKTTVPSSHVLSISYNIPTVRPQRPVLTSQRTSKRTAVRTQAAELEEIDPLTGEILTGTVSATTPTETVTTPSGLTWAVRSATPDASNTEKPQELLLLHGLGSSSYAYRNTLQLLAGSGFKAWAVDWIGHGASSKVCEGLSTLYPGCRWV